MKLLRKIIAAYRAEQTRMQKEWNSLTPEQQADIRMRAYMPYGPF